RGLHDQVHEGGHVPLHLHRPRSHEGNGDRGLESRTMAETMEVLNPATEEVLGVVPSCSAEDVDVAVETAKAALPGWLETTPGERSEILLGLARVLEENSDELAGIESANVGKPLAYARDEMPIMVDHMRFFAGAARFLEGKSTGEYMRGYTSMIRREPLGGVGGVPPGDYPLMMAGWEVGPAPPPRTPPTPPPTAR